MKTLFVSFVAGVLFALGLGLSGMTDPNKVIGFLDPLGGWDPSLAFVMAGGLGIHFATYRWITRREAPLLGGTFRIAPLASIDRRLLLGAGLFGVGWALSGVCPGPAVVSVASGSTPALVFFGAMTLGMVSLHAVDSWSARPVGANTVPAPGAECG